MSTTAKNNHGLLPPITLNTLNISKKSSPNGNGSSTKKPNPNANLTSLEPSPLPGRISRNLSQLEEMEPPPPIPAAIAEQGYRARPSSTHSARWRDDAVSDDGSNVPTRRNSAGSGSTTAWAGGGSPGESSAAGPSNNNSRGRWHGTGLLRGVENNSTASVDGGDEMDYGDGTSTPRSRRSVFQPGTRPSGEDYSAGEDLETPIANKRPSFFQRLKSLGGTTAHGRSQSGWTVDSVSGADSPFTPNTPRPPYAASDGGYLDEGADLEVLPHRRRSFSPGASGAQTPRIDGMRRRATLTGDDGNDTDRSRSRYNFSRRSSFKNRVSKRRSIDGERPSYMPNYRDSAAKWRALKAGIRMIGRKQKEESKIDREKSAELVAELSAATPAAVILASMFQRDEHGHRRIPVLLEQLKVQLTDSTHSRKGAGRAQTTFRLELEYGSGLTRMKWVIHREFRDFFNLHSRYRLADVSGTSFTGGGEGHKLPKFPRSTIPYLRGVRGLGSDDESGEEGMGGFLRRTQTDATMRGPADRQQNAKKERPLRRMSATADDIEHAMSAGIAAGIAAATAAAGPVVQQAMQKRESFNMQQRRQLEDYVRRLIRQMIFRPDSNRLCKFLELSALGVRLAAEGSYHGKEGYLIIRSAKGSDFKRPWNPSQVARRHAPKWFLVRHSYIVCVDSPEEMNIYDVFLVDSAFQVDTKRFLQKPRVEPVSATNPARTQHHRLTVQNHERRVKLLAKNERQLQQFQQSMNLMRTNSLWSRPQRFESYAPVRKGVFAQWLVDGRDYFWNVSRAISMAKDVIYIHDWWLSPELVRFW